MQLCQNRIARLQAASLDLMTDSPSFPETQRPIEAARQTAISHGISPDRVEVLQNGNTVVLRLTETLVARVVADLDGPRQGGEWFSREIAVAEHLARAGAPVIPVHPDIPPAPHECDGYTLNFWQYVERIPQDPDAVSIGSTLYQCHNLLRSFGDPLPELAILHESRNLLGTLEQRGLFPHSTLALLREALSSTIQSLSTCNMQPLHGDAHLGNLMNTAQGLLWTDWEDTFSGPVEWDLASIIWNARLLDEDHATADGILNAYRDAGGLIDDDTLHQCLIARAAVMSAWYPILYPDAGPERMQKLQMRLDWLRSVMPGVAGA